MDILYEDDAILFVNKPAGMVVQRGHNTEEDVLFEVAEERGRALGEELYMLQRLDRGTSGVMFFSKLARANRSMTRMFEQKEVHKMYLALCEGEVSQPQWIDAPIARIGPIKFGVRPEGKRSVTRLVPLLVSPQATLIAIRLLTGRTHQIRVHLSAIGHPLVGDWLYGERNDVRPMLHAWRLSLPHPLDRQRILDIEAPLPEDFLLTAKARGLRMEQGIEPFRDALEAIVSQREDGVSSKGVEFRG